MDEQKQVQEQPKPLDSNKYAIAAFLFILSYGALFALGSAQSFFSWATGIPIVEIFLPLPGFTSLMYFLLPIAGFFFIFFLVEWVNKFFKGRQGFSPLLPALFFILAIIAFYVALFWYIGNYAQLSGRPLTIDEANSLFLTRFKSSAYYLLILGGLFGWLSRWLLEKIKL